MRQANNGRDALQDCFNPCFHGSTTVRQSFPPAYHLKKVSILVFMEVQL
ncbi:Uncharacterized protein dnl_30530 [Desulfonema limicola]|uniref:Uncharacterized protein n=1 Tax=Desulfonema limicola TaxID=45656 RepID=A0A975B8B8_9BACT|nr:Uncharacterized protein dnl_30530 [Desulfonema limicola]